VDMPEAPVAVSKSITNSKLCLLTQPSGWRRWHTRYAQRRTLMSNCAQLWAVVHYLHLTLQRLD